MRIPVYRLGSLYIERIGTAEGTLMSDLSRFNGMNIKNQKGLVLSAHTSESTSESCKLYAPRYTYRYQPMLNHHSSLHSLFSVIIIIIIMIHVLGRPCKSRPANGGRGGLGKGVGVIVVASCCGPCCVNGSE